MGCAYVQNFRPLKALIPKFFGGVLVVLLVVIFLTWEKQSHQQVVRLSLEFDKKKPAHEAFNENYSVALLSLTCISYDS